MIKQVIISLGRFFCATPKDLNMQPLTEEQILDYMRARDEETMNLPRIFALRIKETLGEEKNKPTTVTI